MYDPEAGLNVIFVIDASPTEPSSGLYENGIPTIVNVGFVAETVALVGFTTIVPPVEEPTRGLIDACTDAEKS